MNDHDEGLGLSSVVYALAMLGALVLCVAPVVWANGAAVYENPAATTSDLPGGPAYASRPADFPLAVLKHQQIVDSKMLAELNKPSDRKPAVAHHRARPAQRAYAQAPEAGEPRAPRSFFSLF